ncbi:hypothetical protein BJ684DRAFT_20301 [Piptocephalis cylindrospora]|uniref:BZIP domain-containing protein n=1 Tax=Piptocephalis cylindrospora TaxID=1907219 RepID=A0A4P9Y3C8_9FUNG|nr:hypothetical protein BJ684DRAFT_20301 [Piptocephalis cylindrospora]|eukprot:RKP13194.1 hypothetical protein BJ684DRAFT_20301 [Piptocephalis cylindrospora]
MSDSGSMGPSGPSTTSNSLTLPPILSTLPPSFTSPSPSSSSSSSSSSAAPKHPGAAVPLRQSSSMGHFQSHLPPLTSAASSGPIPSTRVPSYSRVVVLSEPGVDDPHPPHPYHLPPRPSHPYQRPYTNASTSSLPSSPYASASSSVSSLLDEDDPIHLHPQDSSYPRSSDAWAHSTTGYYTLPPPHAHHAHSHSHPHTHPHPFHPHRNRPIHPGSSSLSPQVPDGFNTPNSSSSSAYSPVSSSSSSPIPSVPTSPSASPSTSPSSSSTISSSPLNGKALSALERRRLRNQKSSAAFRARRKQYQADLEQGIMTLQSTLHRAVDPEGKPMFQDAMSEMRSAVLTLPKMEQDSGLVGTGLASLPPEIAMLSPAERRRFQNKLSARVFRERRRQLIAALEQDFKALLSLHRTAPEVFPLRALPVSLYPMCGIKEDEEGGKDGSSDPSSPGQGALEEACQ